MKKIERKTKDEKRRLLLTRKYVTSQKRIQKYGTDSVGEIAVDFNKRFVAAFMALVFALSVLVVGVNFATRADDGKDYESAKEITFTNNSYTCTEAIDSGTLCKYVVSGKTYAFTTNMDLEAGDTLTLGSDNQITQTYLPGKNRENIEDYTTATKNADGTITFTYSTSSTEELKKDQEYYYKDGSTYYVITPSEDIGFEQQESREEGEYETLATASITITLNPSTETVSYSGTKYTRRMIYVEDTGLSENQIYLVGAYKKGKDYLLQARNTPFWSLDYCTDGAIQKCDNYVNGGETAYGFDYKEDSALTVAANTFYDQNGSVLKMDGSSITGRRYFDGKNGQIDPNDIYNASGNYDPYVMCELSSKNRSASFGFTGTTLRAFDGVKYYTDARCLGTVGTTSLYAQERIIFHTPCYKGLISHNNGNIWTYDYSEKVLKNNNVTYADMDSGVWGVGGACIMNFETELEKRSSAADGLFHPWKYYREKHYYERTSGTAGTNWEANVGLGFYTLHNATSSLFGNPYQYHAVIYLYRMMNAYTSSSISGTMNYDEDEGSTSTVTAIPLENATVTLTYDGADNSTKGFSVTLNLKDDSGNLASGTYPGTLAGTSHDFEFVGGVSNETLSLKDGDSVIITNIPYNYSIAVIKDETDSTQTTITQKDTSSSGSGTEISSGTYVQLTTDKEIDISVVRDTSIALEVVAPDGVANASAQFCGYYNYDNSGKAGHSLDVNDDTGEVTFYAVFSDSDPTDLATITSGSYSLGYTMPTYGSYSDTKVYTRVNAAFVDTTEASKYNVSVYINGTQISAYSSPSAYTDVSSGWRETNGSEHTLLFKYDNVIRVVYTGINQTVTITHNVDGSPTDKANATNLKLKLSLWTSDACTTGVPLTITDTDGTSYTFGNDGVCTTELSLVDAASKTFNIPYGYYLKVEDADDYSDNYSTTYASSNVVKAETGNAITVTHKRNAHSVIITEETTGTFADTTREFPIELALTYNGSGYTGNVPMTGSKSGTLRFENGELDATSNSLLKLKDGESVTLAEIPSGAYLTVNPTDANYYNHSVDKTGATVIDDDTSFTVTYARENITDTGVLNNTNGLSAMMYVLVGVCGLIALAVFIYMKHKKSENII